MKRKRQPKPHMSPLERAKHASARFALWQGTRIDGLEAPRDPAQVALERSYFGRPLQ